MDFDADTSSSCKVAFLSRTSETAPCLMDLTLSQLTVFFSFVSLFKAPDINSAALFNAFLLLTKPRFLPVDLWFFKNKHSVFSFLTFGTLYAHRGADCLYLSWLFPLLHNFASYSFYFIPIVLEKIDKTAQLLRISFTRCSFSFNLF